MFGFGMEVAVEVEAGRGSLYYCGARIGKQSQLQIRLISFPHTHPGNKFDFQFIQYPIVNTERRLKLTPV